MQYKGKGGILYNLEDKPFAQGGEGQVFNVTGKPNIVAKLYKSGKNSQEKERKLIIMVDNPPSKTVMSQIAWPLDVLYDNMNRFVGFIMPKLAINEDLNVIYEYGSSAKYGKIPWNNKIIVAKNLCAVLNAVHDAGHVVGDLNPKNISVDPNTGHVIFVDTDSYHIDDNGKTYRCEVGMPEYIAAEIQKKMGKGISLKDMPLPTFSKESDNFALAIHIFQLLMNGCHPFACRVLPSQSSVVFPQPTDNILKGIFPFVNAQSGTAIPAYAPPLNILPKEMQDLFKRAFIEGYNNPSVRPTAEEWFYALTNLEKNLTKCSQVSYHEYYKGLTKCPWCEADGSFNKKLKTATTNKPPITQSTITQSMGRTRSAVRTSGSTYNTANRYNSSNSSRNNSTATVKTYHKTKVYSDSNPLVIVLAIIAILGGFLMFANVSWLPLVVCLGLGVATEIIALVKGGTEFNKFWIVLFWILSIATLITLIVLTEQAFAGFGQQRDAVKAGNLSEQYYQNNVREIRIFLILIAIVQVGFGAFFGYKYRDNEFVLGMIPVLMIIVFVFICFVFSINNNIFKFITETPASWHKRDFWGYFWDLLLIGVISIIFHGLCTLELNAVSD